VGLMVGRLNRPNRSLEVSMMGPWLQNSIFGPNR
jgi:hypothetical protein